MDQADTALESVKTFSFVVTMPTVIATLSQAGAAAEPGANR